MADPVDKIGDLERRIADLERRAAPSPWRARLRQRPRSALVVLALVIGLLLPAGVVLAAHRFGDVADSHTFHADIDRIADAGITTGCTPSTFCPGEGVTRGQMAGFLGRSLGRASADSGTITFAEMLDGTPIAQVTIKTGGVSGGSGFIVVTASAQIQATDGACPCDVAMAIRRGTSDYSPVSLAVARTQIQSGWWMGNASVTWVFDAPSGTDQTIELVTSGGVTWQGGDATTSFAKGMVTAVFVPFGATGGSSMGAQANVIPANATPEP